MISVSSQKRDYGAFDTWTYDHLGIFGWTVELWSPMKQAGLKGYKYIDWFRNIRGR